MWQADIKPSRIHQCLTLILALASLLSIASLSISEMYKLLPGLIITMLATRQMFRLQQTTKLSMHQNNDANGKPVWQLQRTGQEPMTGTLIQAGYRSAGLVVIVMQSDDTRRYRIPVWVDAVSATQFSYLHFQIAFNAQPAQPLSLRAMLY